MRWFVIAIAVLQILGRSESSIKLTLRVNHPKISANQPLTIRFEILNESGHDLYVCRRILENSNWPCDLEIWIEDMDGKRYGPPRTAGAQGRTDSSETVAEAISKWYFLLPNDYSYGSTTTLASPSGHDLKLKPGKYKIRAKYVSLNLGDSLGWFNAALSKAGGIANLHDREWSGEVEALPVPVEIVP